MGRVEAPIAVYRGQVSLLRAHPAYAAAKAGDPTAAILLVADLVAPLAERVLRQVGPGCIFVAPHAIEAAGRNKIPQALAVVLARETDGELDGQIVQAVRAFHTGASRMERLIARPEFDGPVVAGAQYIVVDDVMTSGSTLAELADHIHRGGGEVVGAVVCVDASRTGRLAPDPHLVRVLDRSRGDVLRQEFGIEPAALTADESQLVNGVRTADALRDRGAAARQDRIRRLHAAGVRAAEDEAGS